MPCLSCDQKSCLQPISTVPRIDAQQCLLMASPPNDNKSGALLTHGRGGIVWRHEANGADREVALGLMEQAGRAAESAQIGNHRLPPP